MATVFAALLVVHGVIHVLGAAKAFGWAELPQLTQRIPPGWGVLWLGSALLFFATTVSLFVWPRAWWLIGAGSVAVSMLAIVPSWADAWVGAIANGIVLVGLVFGFLSQGPLSLRAEYDADVDRGGWKTSSSGPVADAELAHLPAPVQNYLRLAGVVGQLHVSNFRVRMHGRIRGGPHDRWMPFTAEQFNTVQPHARFFYLNASMFFIPVQGYHRYAGSSASMRVKAAALVTVAGQDGPEMTQSETVTLFNDMCIMAPATLIDPAIRWEAVDGHTARARFTTAGHTIGAELSFSDAGELANFVSDDRSQASSRGTGMRPLRWSTPLGHHRSFGRVRLASGGEGRWHEPGGEYA